MEAGRSRPEARRTLTFMGAEAMPSLSKLYVVEHQRGSIAAACVCAAGVLLAVEPEETQLFPVSIPTYPATDH